MTDIESDNSPYRRLDISLPQFWCSTHRSLGIPRCGLVFGRLASFWLFWVMAGSEKDKGGIKEHLTETIELRHIENSDPIYPSPFIIMTLPFNNSFSVEFESDVKFNILNSFSFVSEFES